MPSARNLSSRFGTTSGPMRGALYMTAAALGFSVMNVVIRMVSAELDPLQVAFFRNLFALSFMLPWLMRVGFASLRTTRLGMHVWRAVFGLAAMVCWFYAIALLPLAEAVALNFTVPLFATAGAAVVLSETVRARRWTATVVGFLGVLIILRPGFVEVTPAMALPVVAAAFMAAAVLIVKSLSRTEAPGTVVLYMNLILTPLSLTPALFVWRWPDGPTWLLLILLGVVAALAHLALTRAYAAADASFVVPFDYARLPLIAVIAYFAFGEVPGIWTWVGGAVIAASALYILRREARLPRTHKSLPPADEAVRSRPIH